MHSMRWGLVPHWSKAEPPTLNTTNARAENLEEGGGMWAASRGGNVASLSPKGTTNGSRSARSASHILHGIEINGSCSSPGCTTRSLSRVSSKQNYIHARYGGSGAAGRVVDLIC
ncbi:hypothetical protein DFH94DRAFT_12005 [Russula ochroleuca]|uniref:Uncharacterized protein n=1 Tax=Russula ochroleuca TaxID=152965 RepID=A0A9P5N5V2_9AGAM|nr:hypothetical protein DFH94DRAFT_12005 [Russula ochroleuca]